MKRVLITGNSGYIGSHLTKMMQGKYVIHGLDINEPQAKVSKHHTIDICTDFKIEETYDAVIHLAASVNVGESVKMPTLYYNTNLAGTLNMITSVKYKHFILASTGAAESCNSPYGVSKRASEDVVREMITAQKLPYTIFRFYNVIGSDGYEPTNPDGLMYNLMKARETGEFTIHGNDYENGYADGTCVRDYVHVNEICDALIQAVEKPSNSIECLGHGVGHTVKEIAELFQKVNECEFTIKYGPRREGDVASSVLEETSEYMKNLYSIEDLLKVDK
jgi:UDP-glucose 4-epimerase